MACALDAQPPCPEASLRNGPHPSALPLDTNPACEILPCIVP